MLSRTRAALQVDLLKGLRKNVLFVRISHALLLTCRSPHLAINAAFLGDQQVLMTKAHFLRATCEKLRASPCIVHVLGSC
jgi:hypothetical protein